MSKIILGCEDLSEIAFTTGARLILSDGPLELGWRHSGLTSDFIAEAMALPFAGSTSTRTVIQNHIGYLSNELMENAIKFRLFGMIVVEACIEADLFLMRVRNEIDASSSARFQEHLQHILSGDAGERLIQQIEANAVSDVGGSGLGLLTLLSDYDARMSWEFEPSGENRVSLTTTASLTLPMSLNG